MTIGDDYLLLVIIWSLLSAMIIIPHFVLKRFESRYGNKEWLLKTFSTSWDTMGDVIAPKIVKSFMNTFNGIQGKTAQMLESGLDETEDAIIDQVSVMDPRQLAQFSQFAKSYSQSDKIRNTLQMVQEFMPLIQQLGNNNGNNYFPPQGGSRGGW